jgi:hypothetical protein
MMATMTALTHLDLTVKSHINAISHRGARDVAVAAFCQELNARSIAGGHKMLCFRAAESAHNHRHHAKSLKTLMYAGNGI